MQSRLVTPGALSASASMSTTMAHDVPRLRRLASIIEAGFVLMTLLTIAALSGGQMRDWMASAAVFLTFLHAQLAFDFDDSQNSLPTPAVQNYRWAGRLFVTKELLWLMTFFMTGSWPLCFGSFIFATYPHWRKVVRRVL